MNFLDDFAKTYRFTVTKNVGDDDDVIVGPKGTIYIHGGPTLAACIEVGWGRSKPSLIDAGCVVSQNGDHEGVVVFDPRQARQAKQAIHAVGLDIKAKPADLPENTVAAKQQQSLLPLRPLTGNS